MRRLLSFALAAMLLLSLFACGEENRKETESEATAAITESATQTDDPTEKQTKGNHEVISLSFIKTFDQNPSIEEQVIYEKDNLSITAKSIRYDTVHGPQIMLAINNKTENDLLIQNDYTSVNGFMIKPEIDIKVPAKKKAESPMSLPYLNLAMAGINSLSEVRFSLRILDSKTFSVVDTTEPVSLKLLNTAKEKATFDTSGQLAYNSNGVKIILQGLKMDTLFESENVLMVYMENHTNKIACIKNNKLTVNGYELTVSMSTAILPGMKAVDKIELYDQDLEEFGITAIDAVNASFEIYDYEKWKLVAKSDTVSVELPTEAPTEDATSSTEK